VAVLGIFRSIVVAITGCALIAAACSHRTSAALPSSGQLAGANVLLITIDTLRQDRVGGYGNDRGLTPSLDALASAGIRYAHAYSHVPMTLPAHTSILTGLTPLSHGVRNNTAFRLDTRIPTLAERMKAAGYRTGAFVGSFVLDARFGLSRGFDEYDDRLPRPDRATFRFSERRAEEVLRLASTWILSRPAPPAPPGRPAPLATPASWFAWVHLFDPHAPYDAPPAYRAGRSPYDAEVAYTDAMIGQFVDRLRAAHALDRTLVVVTADHGESLGEHGETTHGLFAYQATTAVPLIINGPLIRAGVVDDPVSHSDITPTILDLVGARVPERIDGQSLSHEPSADRPIYMEALDAFLTRGWAPLQAVVQRGWKLIDLPEPELYDLSADSGEQRSLPQTSPHAGPLERVLLQWRAARQSDAPEMPMDGEAAARLRSLGYVSASVAHKGAFTVADDPKHLVALNETFNTALTAFDEGRADEALAGFLSVLRERPDFVSARTSAATVLVTHGRANEAVRLLSDAPSDQKESPEILGKLGGALQASGDPRGAAAALERARGRRPHDDRIAEDLAVAYASMGRMDDARATLHEMLEGDPRAVTGWYNLGLVELQTRRLEPAAEALRHAVDVDPGYADAWRALGFALVGRDTRAAAEAWREADRLRPGDFDLLFNLAMVLADSDRPADAVPYLRRFLRDAPPAKYAPDLARVRATLARIEQRPS
jgi:arylsulfatase A-like enzyme/tetratricopeptide (TPR) repeat protein